jgi:hypothetical protein
VVELRGERHQASLSFPYETELGDIGDRPFEDPPKYDPPEIRLNDPLHPSTEKIIEVLSGEGWLESEEPPNVDRVEELNEDPPELLETEGFVFGESSPERPRDLLWISSRYKADENARTLANQIMDRERLELVKAWRGITLSYYVDRVLRDGGSGKTGTELERVQVSGPWETEDQALGWIARERFSTEEITRAINDLNDFLNYPEDQFFDRNEWEEEISLIRDLLRRIQADVKEREG